MCAAGDETIAGGTLAALVQGADSLRQMRALVDCEISFGNAGRARLADYAFQPAYKVGAALCIRLERESRLAVSDLDEAGGAIVRMWDIAEEEGDGSAILDTIRQNF